jgi:hypothetical protein
MLLMGFMEQDHPFQQNGIGVGEEIQICCAEFSCCVFTSWPQTTGAGNGLLLCA